MQKQRNQGSGLFVVLIIATVLAIGIYSSIDLVSGEFVRNKKSSVYNEAKQAAESLLQASMADLKNRFESQTAFPIDSLSPTRNPLFISDEFTDLYTSSGSMSHLVIPTKTKYTALSDFNSQDTEIIGGQIPPGRWRYIDPRIPGNQYDELAGTRVFERSIEMISKATVDRPSVGQATVFARQFLQVRDAPLFAYAIFYNLPMEIAPGPKMDVFGNVHSNKSSWLQAGSGLDLHDRVTIAGELQHGRHPDSGLNTGGGPVRISDTSGQLVSMNQNGAWLTSLSNDFFNLANQTWGGNLQTGDHGILPQNPVGVRDYIEDTDPSTDRKESLNSAYNIIQPVLERSELAIPSAVDDPIGHEVAQRLNEIEQQKYAYKAGLTIKVANDGSLSYHTYRRRSDGTLRYESTGEPRITDLTPATPIASFESFSESGNTVTSGLHDKRQAQDLNIINLDVEKLKDLVHGNERDDWGTKNRHKPDRWWNGVVYVDFPQQASSSSRPDHVNPGAPGWGVKLTNGDIIPNPSFAHSQDIYGMSVATNQTLYVEGNFNADGDRSTGSPTTPDNEATFAQEGHEAPAALIADSITFLSNDWDDADSTSSISNRRAVDTEVSAAILTGLVPSGESGSNSYSGGVENFPRFLENWSGRSLRIRGSIVALFESEVATRRWGHGDVYSPPGRDWGFHQKFAEGFLPPGTPNTRNYRGVDFQLITENEYLDHIARIKTYF